MEANVSSPCSRDTCSRTQTLATHRTTRLPLFQRKPRSTSSPETLSADLTSASCATSARAHRIEKTRVADFRGIFRELDIDPGDDIAERTILEGPSRSVCRSYVVVGYTIDCALPRG